MYKVLAGCVVIIAVLLFFLKSLHDDVQTLTQQNSLLQKTIEANLQAAKQKEERNRNELERLQKQLTKLSKIDDACLANPVSDDLVVFLQQLQRDSDGTISFTFTEQGRMSDKQ